MRQLMANTDDCPDCGASVGEAHDLSCAVNQCRLCGDYVQRCGCIPPETEDRADYFETVEANGGPLEWPGKTPDMPDTNAYVWDIEAGRWQLAEELV